MIFVEGMLWSPLAFLLLSPVFRNSDASFEEAASICGAGLVFDASARHDRHGAAGAAGAGPARLHQGVGVLRGAGAGRPAGLDSCADQHDLSALDVDMPPDVGSASAFGVLLLVVMAVLLQSTAAWRRRPIAIKRSPERDFARGSFVSAAGATPRAR